MRPFLIVPVLFALVFVPGPAHAQESEAPPADAAERPPETVSAPPLMPVEAAPPEEPIVAPPSSSQAFPRASARDPNESRFARGLLELLGGTAAVIVGGYATLSLASEGCGGGLDDCAVAAILLTMSSTVVTAPLGVWAGGTAGGGRGSLGTAVVGSLLGGVVGFLSGLGLGLTGGGLILILTTPLGALVGSIIGFETSHVPAPPPGLVLSPGGVRVTPVVGATRDGGLVGGLVGSF